MLVNNKSLIFGETFKELPQTDRFDALLNKPLFVDSIYEVPDLASFFLLTKFFGPCLVNCLIAGNIEHPREKSAFCRVVGFNAIPNFHKNILQDFFCQFLFLDDP